MKRFSFVLLAVFALIAPASAQTFYAHVETGKALEPQPAASVQAYLNMVGVGVNISSWIVHQVPSTVHHGAIDNGDGTFTDPPAAPAVAKHYSPTEFMDLCYGAFGTVAQPSGTMAQKIAAGIARFGAVIRAARASANDSVLAVVERYDAARAGGGFEKDQVSTFVQILTAAGIMTADEGAAVIAGWQNQ